MIEQDSPNVLAYRVGQLEKTQEKGFVELKEQNGSLIRKIDILAHNFASKSDVEAIEKRKNEEHIAIEKRLNSRMDGHRDRIVKMENLITWVGRIVFGAVIAGVLSVVIVTGGSV